jgi:predicted signal transduction protein with EAL and GGDEF domain
VPTIVDQDVVEALAAHGPHEPLREGIRPRCTDRRSDDPDALGSKHRIEGSRVLDMKGLNDRDGHAAGDQALRSLVSIMRANVRSFDPVVRYGGDEFVCGIGGVGIADVERRFGVIDAALRHELRVGISVGLAALEGAESLDELTARADANLLEAKRGRSLAAGRDGNARVGLMAG